MPTANLFLHIKFTADPAALVYKDKVYIYTGSIDYLYYNKDGTIKRVIMTGGGVQSNKN